MVCLIRNHLQRRKCTLSMVFKPPDLVISGAGAQDVHVTIAVQIHGKNIMSILRCI